MSKRPVQPVRLRPRGGRSRPGSGLLSSLRTGNPSWFLLFMLTFLILGMIGAFILLYWQFTDPSKFDIDYRTPYRSLADTHSLSSRRGIAGCDKRPNRSHLANARLSALPSPHVSRHTSAQCKQDLTQPGTKGFIYANSSQFISNSFC